MDVGIGLPNAVRGVGRAGIVDWAQRAERAGFASLGTIDRVVYPNYECLIALAAASADEVICFPASHDVGQVELLAEAALG